MGFPHCPICVVLALVSAFIGVTRSYMFFILLMEFIRERSKFKLQYSFTKRLTSKYKYFINKVQLILQNRPIYNLIDRSTTQAIGRGLEQVQELHHGKHVFQWKVIRILQKTGRKDNKAHLQRIYLLEIRFLIFF